MDEHDERAREVVPHLPGAAGAYRQEIEQRIAAALREAVVAERERCRAVALEYRNSVERRLSDYPEASADAGGRYDAADAIADRIAEGAAPAPLAASPAQAERVSEEEQGRVAETVRMLRCIAQMYVSDSPGGMALDHAISVLANDSAVAEAVAHERERCAKLVEQYGGESDFCPNGCSMGYLADVLRSEADALKET